MKKASASVLPSAAAPVSFKGCRFPPDIISYAVWLYYRFPLSLRVVEEMLAARGIELAYSAVSGQRSACEMFPRARPA
jgi:transposase-like protein